MKKDFLTEKLDIINAINKNNIPITIDEGKKNIPIRKKIKPYSSKVFTFEK